MQAADTLPDVFNCVLPDLRNDGNNLQMTYDNTGDYNFGAALTDWGMNTLDLNSNSSPSGSDSSQLEPVMSQDMFVSASTHATPVPASQDGISIISVEDNDEIICYGMVRLLVARQLRQLTHPC